MFSTNTVGLRRNLLHFKSRLIPSESLTRADLLTAVLQTTAKDVETHQVLYLAIITSSFTNEQAFKSFFWPKVCDTNNCFALLQIPTKFQTVLTALGPGLHDEDTAINLTLLVILHTEN